MRRRASSRRKDNQEKIGEENTEEDEEEHDLEPMDVLNDLLIAFRATVRVIARRHRTYF